jgi:hypothetical protein
MGQGKWKMGCLKNIFYHLKIFFMFEDYLLLSSIIIRMIIMLNNTIPFG